tara:strand:- start:669 stop:878 length:210 start_codon:yes stop_codon:yes gene_type:complete
MLLVDLVENATDVHYVVETRNIEAEETFDTKILLDVDRYGESPLHYAEVNDLYDTKTILNVNIIIKVCK